MGLKELAMDRALECEGGGDGGPGQAGEEGRGLPLAVGRIAVEALALRAPAPQGRHVGLHPGLVDEDQPVRIDPGLERAPALASPYNIRTQPLIGDGGFF